MARANRDGGSEALHDWRKAVKRHRYHLQFLHGAPPDESITDLARLEELGELLGEDHDLAVLEATVANDARSLPGGAARDRLSAAITQRRRALKAKAGPLGERLFGMRPRTFRGRLQSRLRQEHQERVGVHGSGHGHHHPPVQTDSPVDPRDRRWSTPDAAPLPVVIPSTRRRLTLA
jgi:CHAD domain-containing protein